MAYQSEAELENLLIEQLANQGYSPVTIQSYEELEENFNSFTLNVYGRANMQQKIKCMNLLNDLL